MLNVGFRRVALAVGVLGLSAGAFGAGMEMRPLSEVQLRTPGYAFSGAAYSPDGKYFVLAGSDVYLFDTARRRVVKSLDPDGHGARSISFSHDGKFLAMEYPNYDATADEGKLGNDIEVLSMPDGKPVAHFASLTSFPQGGRRIRMSPDGKLVATADSTGITVFDVGTGKATWEWKNDIAVNPNNSYGPFDATPDFKTFLYNLASVSYPEKVVTAKARFDDTAKPFYQANYILPDGKQAIACGEANGSTYKLFDLESGTMLGKFQANVQMLTVSPDGKQALHPYGIWTIGTTEGVKLHPYLNFSWIGALAWSPDGKEVSIGNLCFDPTTARGEGMELEKMAKGRWFNESMAGLSTLFDFSGEGMVLSGTNGSSVVMVDLMSGKWTPSGRTDVMPGGMAAGFKWDTKATNATGTMGASEDGKITYPTNTNKPAEPFLTADQLKEFAMGVPAFSAKGQLMFVTRTKLLVVDPATKKVLKQIDRTGGIPQQVTVSADGKFVATGEQDQKTPGRTTFAVINVESGKTVVEPMLVQSGGMLFVPAGGGWLRWAGRKAYLYEPGTGKPRVIAASAGSIARVSASADGKHLALANVDGRCEVVDAGTGKLLCTVFIPNTLTGAVFDAKGAILSVTEGPWVAELFYSKKK